MTDTSQQAPSGADLDDELLALAQETAGEARTYLLALRGLGTSMAGDTALPILLLALAQIQVAGARLGAMVDIVPSERFEPDAGPDPDVDGMREAMAALLSGVDTYVEVADPILSAEVGRGDISNDLAAVAADLAHGLIHFDRGAVTEALWWWQFSYLSSWGERAAAALRAILALLSHVRLDADEETVMEAEMAALHASDGQDTDTAN